MLTAFEKFSARKIYLITTEDNWPVKIGVSHTPEKRLKALQCASWKELKIFKLFDCCGPTAAAFTLEAKIHRELKYKQLSGEWFDIKAEDALNLIEYEILCSES